MADDEAAIRAMLEAWAAAVRRRDYEGILANHAADLVMFDVPPPFEIKGLEAYRASWEMFFSWSADAIPYAFTDMSITAGADVAFVVATLKCAEPGLDGEQIPLEFRLTTGLRKIAGQWVITHEHHSVPAKD